MFLYAFAIVDLAPALVDLLFAVGCVGRRPWATLLGIEVVASSLYTGVVFNIAALSVDVWPGDGLSYITVNLLFAPNLILM